MDILTTATTDLNPPRYAIESDDEDEYNPLPRTVSQPQFDINFLGDLKPQSALIVGTGDPGAFWAKGAHLGEQAGAVAVNGVQIGLVFTPEWTNANVIVSEVPSRLPVWAMHPYAQAVTEKLQPTNIALLDEYSVPSYITNTPVSLPDASIQYLSTTTFNPGDHIQPFTPPNLISTTSASFLSILDITSTLLLLPSPNLPKPAPRTIEPNNATHLTQDITEWPIYLMVRAHELLLHVINGTPGRKWDLGLGESDPALRIAPGRSEIGEGGMYI